MSRKEDVESIRRIVRDKNIVDRAVTDFRAAVKEKIRADELRRKEKEREDLERTGVVAFFEALRDGGVVRWSDEPMYEARKEGIFLRRRVQIKVGDYHPAEVRMSGNYVSIVFNHRGGQDFAYDENFVSAYLDGDWLVVNGSEKRGVPVVNGVADRGKMVQVVGKAILSPGTHTKIDDGDWGLT